MSKDEGATYKEGKSLVQVSKRIHNVTMYHSISHEIFVQIMISLISCFASLSVGATFATSSFLVPQIQEKQSSLHVSIEEGSWIGQLYCNGIDIKIIHVFLGCFYI